LLATSVSVLVGSACLFSGSSVVNLLEGIRNAFARWYKFPSFTYHSVARGINANTLSVDVRKSTTKYQCLLSKLLGWRRSYPTARAATISEIGFMLMMILSEVIIKLTFEDWVAGVNLNDA
jgi:hypothetical protein